MKKLAKKYRKVLENLQWNIRQNADGAVEIENWSPAGENLVCLLDTDDIVTSAYSLWQDFDVDGHVYLWLESKFRGDVRGVPCVSVLAKDAETIDEMLYDLYRVLLMEERGWRDEA